MEKNIRAVITGDLVQSKLFSTERQELLQTLTSILKESSVWDDPTRDSVVFSKIFRGDSFQGLVVNPENALKPMIYIKARLLQVRINEQQVDVRLGLGIGPAENLNVQDIEASDGEAFRLSGKALDGLKASQQKYRRFSFLAADENLNPGLELLAAALDAITQSWSAEQAEAVSHWLRNRTQAEISRILNVQQPAVQQRLRLAGHFALEAGMMYFKSLFK
jgi:hypothetical protein